MNYKKIGVSQFLSNYENDKHLSEAISKGVENIFLSLHIPEEIDGDFKMKVDNLMNSINKFGFKRKICDISHIGIKAIDDSLERMDFFIKNNLEPRLDYGFSKEEIALVSKLTRIWINASTTKEETLKFLLINGNMNNISASHDYYPLNNTGLSFMQVSCQDALLRKYGVNEIVSFIPGTNNFRGPIFEGLPTIEEHRNLDSFNSFHELSSLGHSIIFVGDPMLPNFDESTDEVTVIIKGSEYRFQNKYDVRTSNNLIRLKGTRMMSNSESGESKVENKDVLPTNSKVKIGDVVMLNNNSKRYMGEVAIVTNFIDSKYHYLYNVIGYVDNIEEIKNKLQRVRLLRIEILD